jgi:hypothetical protein
VLIIIEVNESKNVCTFTLKANVRCNHMYHDFNTRPNDNPSTIDLKVPCHYYYFQRKFIYFNPPIKWESMVGFIDPKSSLCHTKISNHHVGFFRILLFSMCSHQILVGLPTCSPISQWVPQHVPNSTLHYPISILGLYKVWYFSILSFFCHGTINDAHHKRKKKNFGRSSQLNNMSYTVLYWKLEGLERFCIVDRILTIKIGF